MIVEVTQVRQTVEIQDKIVVVPQPSLRIITVGSQGPQGIQGEQGEQGDTGAQGDTGDIGHFTEEVPSGSVNGSNAVFALSQAPTGLLLFYNGILQRQGVSNDYVLSGSTITFNVAPHAGATLLAHYFTA